MLVMMANSGRRTRSEWGINSLIHAHMANEASAREAQKRNEAEARDQQERINMLIQSQLETSERIGCGGDVNRRIENSIDFCACSSGAPTRVRLTGGNVVNQTPFIRS